jgi:predicted RNA-binding Zn ribbon-like protein
VEKLKQQTEAPSIGDHLAMDLLNTEMRDAGATLDYWRSGADVQRWLARHGIAPPHPGSAPDLDDLLVQARTLRALARTLVEQRKVGKVADLAGLNGYLHGYASAPHLDLGADGALSLTRVVRADPVAAQLGALAEAVAQLLAEADFALVRQCEHPDCILWFVDRTKAHKRRWCSMAVCGNRYKAAQFRKKSGAAAH